ncbi:MAG TPA: AraC family transcriptional regulator [Ktedonobacterales bacterium]
MAQAMAELGRPNLLPQFPTVRMDERDIAAAVGNLHAALASDVSPLERQTRWLSLLTTLVMRYGADRVALPLAGAEPRAVAEVRAYLEERYAERITLNQLAAQTSLSPFHLVRVFRRAMGIPPHAYLESVRIRHAQHLLERGEPAATVAYATGFASQSHFTERFRRTIGVTPGRYREMFQG